MVIILSGGMDSTTALYKFSTNIVQAITFNYGSNHADQEIKRAKLSCEKLNIKHTVIDLREAFKDIASGLLSGADAIPEGHYEAESMKATVVPGRNMIMLSIAAGIAQSAGAQYVLIASHAGDHHIYKDCRVEFNTVMSQAMQEGTDNGVKLFAPFSIISKRDIAILGDELGVPWEQTYSCYKGGDVQCGVCSTCVERLEALDGLEDHTEYLDNSSWREVVGAFDDSK